ncbi:MAG: NAD(P)-dependent oxidoreductase [Planctomycetes bacterium]|nr:NAD(P)-dependent oxidoreductase [Planctomycetota bacterium]
MRVLVTGAGGFLARSLIPLLAEEHSVVGLLRPGSPHPPGRPDRISWIEHDLASGAWVLPLGIEGVVHLAQSRHASDFPARAEDAFAVNVSGTFHLLDAARRAGVRVFVLGSAAEVYGLSRSHLREDAPARPLDFAAWTHAAAEQLLAQFKSCFPTVALRLFHPYGAGQRNRLVPRLFRSVAEGIPLRLQGADGLRLTPIHSRDVARAIAAAVQLTEPEIINLAGEETTSIRDLGERIGRLVGRTPLFSTDSPSSAGDLRGENLRMKSVLGIVPEVPLDQGLADIWQTALRG